jgi:hypothetical protein
MAYGLNSVFLIRRRHLAIQICGDPLVKWMAFGLDYCWPKTNRHQRAQQKNHVEWEGQRELAMDSDSLDPSLSGQFLSVLPGSNWEPQMRA